MSLMKCSQDAIAAQAFQEILLNFASRNDRLVLAGSVSTRWRQKANFRLDGSTSQCQLAAFSREPGLGQKRALPVGGFKVAHPC